MSQSGQPLRYLHPGQAFLARYGSLQSEQDVWRYVEFLRQEAGLSEQPPIDLSRIYQHFGMPLPLRAPLVDQQGILVDSETGLILIKEDDPIARQRFTEGHELMELLFDAQARIAPVTWDESHKERLCDRGAAELLMPLASFLPKLQELGLSFPTGRSLAKLYQTSLQSTLIRMVQHGSEPAALILWHSALSRKEAVQKLRVWWRVCSPSWTGGFIPKNKSIAANSLIAEVQRTGQPQTGIAAIDFGWGALSCRIEAMPMQAGGKTCVLSLLHRL
jgi:hypothetical protein